VETGDVVLGEGETLRYAGEGKLKLAIVAANCRRSALEKLRNLLKEDGNIYEFHGPGVELGSVCGKPFLVSMLGILDPGESDIFDVVRG
jgi:large subunit ribosomal protein L30e